jgi:hypothetical protein
MRNQISHMRKQARPTNLWCRLQIRLMRKPVQCHEETSKAYQPLVEVADQSHEKPDQSHEKSGQSHEETSKAYQSLVEVAD